jgi:hypothetical protein
MTETVERRDIHRAGRFRFVELDEIETVNEPQWLIEGLMPKSGLMVVYGLPKSGKTFMVTDTALAVASKASWAGRAVLNGGVAYFCGEDRTGFRRRLRGLRVHFGLQATPFALIEEVPNFGCEAGDAEEMIAKLRSWEASTGVPVRMVVIDTLSRTIVGKNESSAQDMSVFVANAEKIVRALNCLVVIIAHEAKPQGARPRAGGDPGPRGSNALSAASECDWRVTKSGQVSTVTITAMRNGPEGAKWTFRLVPCDGPQQSAVGPMMVEFVTFPPGAQQTAAQHKKKLKKDHQFAFDVIKEQLRVNGEVEAGRYCNARFVSRDCVREALKKTTFWRDDRSSNHNRDEVIRALEALQSSGLIKYDKDAIWEVS